MAYIEVSLGAKRKLVHYGLHCSQRGHLETGMNSSIPGCMSKDDTNNSLDGTNGIGVKGNEQPTARQSLCTPETANQRRLPLYIVHIHYTPF